MYCIVGASGFLGTFLLLKLLSATEEKILAVSRGSNVYVSDERIEPFECNVLNSAELTALAGKLRNEKDVKIIYLAAVHNPDYVFSHSHEAAAVNIDALEAFLGLIDGIDYQLYFSSSDTVYGEREVSLRFTEAASLFPVNEYGAQKVAAEKIVLRHGGKVLRYSSLFAPSPVPGRRQFYDVIVSALRSGEEMKLLTDFVRCPLLYSKAAELTVRLCELPYSDVPDILNICSDCGMSKYEVGLAVARENMLDSSLISEITMSDFSGFSEHRAKCVICDNSLLKSTLKINEIKFIG